MNLQVASILINLDLPWNPAVLEQRIARIYRIGQKKNIQVINLVASQTIEERMLSTLNFKSSLFEGILDNGEDTIFLEDSKLDKIMDSIKMMTEPSDTAAEMDENGGCDIKADDNEEKAELSANRETIFDTEQPSVEQDMMAENLESVGKAEVKDLAEHPEQLVRQGVSFFTGLAQALSSPETTQKLVDSIVEEDKETGQTSLRIPVPDKESVTNILNLFGKLLSGGMHMGQ